MAREFSLGFDGLTLANQAVTLVFLSPAIASTAVPNIQILRMWASQQGSATSAQQRVQAETQVSAFPTLVSATPRHLKMGDATASIIAGGTGGLPGTGGINASAEGAGAKTVMFGDNFNVLNGYLWVATPREVIDLGSFQVSTIGGFGLFLPAAASSLGNWAAGINFSEGS
jgi:hypothetical protein